MFSKMLLVVVLGGVTANRPEAPIGKGEKKEVVQPEVADLSGYYTCRGEEANGKRYSGIAVISKKNDVYMVQWMVGTGSTFTGVGIRQGDTFSASWAMTTEKGVIRGCNLYRIETGPTGPRLVGNWATLPGNGVIQPETLSFLKSLDTEEEQ